MSVLSVPRGVVTPLVTPFRNGRVDDAQLCRLIERQIAAGIDGVIVCDQMGEGLALTADERRTVLSCAVSAAAGRIPVVAAAGTNGTSQTIDMISAVPEGVAALLVTVPYYSKPTAKGVVHHFRQIAEATPLPIIIDDDPQRTARALTSEMLQELSCMPTILSVRHCSGDLAAFMTMSAALKRRYTHYAGDDPTALAYLQAGVSSVSSPIANLFPELVRSFHDATRANRGLAENAMRRRLCRAMGALGRIEPPALKQALSLLTGCGRDVRLPLVPIDEDEARSIEAFLDRHHFLRSDDCAEGRLAGLRKFL